MREVERLLYSQSVTKLIEVVAQNSRLRVHIVAVVPLSFLCYMERYLYANSGT